MPRFVVAYLLKVKPIKKELWEKKCTVKYYVQETSPYHECDEVMLSADFEPDGKPVMFYEERKED
jgi:hypothetical protein